MTNGAITVPTPARKVQSPVIGVIHVPTKLFNTSPEVYRGNTLRVKFDAWAKLILFELLKTSPPLFVILVGKEIFAIIGKV